MAERPSESLTNLKTRPSERRLSLAKASLIAGSKVFGSSALNLFRSSDVKEAKRKEVLSQQAQFLIQEIGKLKGSVVKIGQMLALYGEHFLPSEVTEALHQLNNQTQPVAWSTIQPIIQQELGPLYAELEIDSAPIGTASLAQVYRATVKNTGEHIVLKIQYPGIANAIESDLQLFKKLLAVTRLVPQTQELDEWLAEIESLLKQEVNYGEEIKTIKRFNAYLKNDSRYIVPKVFDRYSSKNIIAMTFEHGIPVNDERLQTLNQQQINHLSQAVVDLLLNEIFVYGEMQTDPNFGNFLIRCADNQSMPQLVLLDFGAVRTFNQEMLELARNILSAGQNQNHALMRGTLEHLPFFTSLPDDAKDNIVSVFMLAAEPFQVSPDINSGPEGLWQNQQYHWARSLLHERIVSLTAPMLASKHFALPPKEFMFISRKFIGAYTMLVVLNAQTSIMSVR